MNSAEIEKALRQDKIVSEFFVGVFSSDQIPEKEYPGIYIVNTQPANHQGEHWVAFYCQRFGMLEAFDSYGKNPGSYSEFIKEWMGNDFLTLTNTQRQNNDSTVCGQYCMYFTVLRAYGFSFEDVVSVFTKNKEINDKFVCKFINKFFSLRTRVRDYEFIKNYLLKK